MSRDPDTAFQEDLLEDIRRFPEKYPVSMGGLRPDHEAQHKDYADRATSDDKVVGTLDPLDWVNTEPLDGDDDWPQDDLGPDPGSYDDIRNQER